MVGDGRRGASGTRAREHCPARGPGARRVGAAGIAVIGTIILLVVLLIISGFFSGAEIAVFSISRAKARALLEEGRPGARALVEVKEKPEHALITILIGNNVANIGAASVATYTATLTFGSAGVGLATGIMTVLVLFFGEITPKSFAARNAASLSSLRSRPSYARSYPRPRTSRGLRSRRSAS